MAIKEKNIKELWKPIKGYEGLYEVSNFGNVKSLHNKKRGVNEYYLLKKYVDIYGYVTVCLFTKGIHRTTKVHRLVADAFIQKIPHKPFVNHINGIKTDNNYNNLEWCTSSENSIHAVKMGLQKPICKLVFAFDRCGNFIGKYNSHVEASDALKIPAKCIGISIKRNGWTNNIYFSNENTFNNSNILSKKYRAPIICISPDGITSKFKSANNAAKELKLDKSNICRVLKGERSKYKGYSFEFDNKIIIAK